MKTDFNKLCTPAKLYFVLALLSIIIAAFNGLKLLAIIVKLSFAIVWTLVLSFICDKGFTPVSWFLVLAPLVVMVLVMVGLMRAVNSQLLSTMNATNY
jgi:hypothetical protein